MIGEEWRDAFDILLTRDNTPYVKPDKRSLLHFAEVGSAVGRAAPQQAAAPAHVQRTSGV